MSESNIKKILQEVKALEREPLSESARKSLNTIKAQAEKLISKKSNSITARTLDGKESRVVFSSEPYMVNTDGRNIILYIHGRDRLVVTKSSLREIELNWAKEFTRISRTSLIANSKIQCVKRDETGYKIELTGELGTIEISRRSFYLIRRKLQH